MNRGSLLFQILIAQMLFGCENKKWNEARKCANNAAIKQLGIEWAVQQGKELIQAGVPALHFYTMSKSDSVRAIAEKLF